MEGVHKDDLLNRLKLIPCMFNMEHAVIRPGILKSLASRLKDELDDHENDLMETRRKTNLLTWVLFKLEDEPGALERNREILEITAQSPNVASLGNAAYLAYNSGDDLQVREYVHKMDDLEKCDGFQFKMTEARAEQAYALSRIGGVMNEVKSTEIYRKAIDKFPNIPLWRFGLGLACRRLSNVNLAFSNSVDVDVRASMIEGVKCLFEVADSVEASSQLRAEAYSNLAVARGFSFAREYDNLFRNHSVKDLCSKALEKNDSFLPVLTHCGRSLCRVDLDWSINLLRKSVQHPRNSIAFHHLGKNLISKAKQNAGKQTPRINHRLFGRNSAASSSDGGWAKRGHYTGKWSKDVSQACGAQRYTYTSQSSTYQDNRAKVPAWNNGGNSRMVDMQGSREGGTNSVHRKPIGEAANLRGATSVGMGPCRSLAEESHSGVGRKSTLNITPNTKLAEQRGFVKSPQRTAYLNRSDPLVVEAIECLNKAINLSQNNNLSAVYDLGLVYKDIGEHREALKQFRKITRRSDSSQSDIVKTISAFEQAGMCLRVLHESDPDKEFDEEADRSFERAIELAVNLATRIPEWQNCATEVWNAFRLQESRLESGNRRKELINLLWLVKNHGKLLSIVEDQDLDDPGIFEKTLESHLQGGQPEKALCFLTLAKARPKCQIPFGSLEIRVSLAAAECRLNKNFDNAKDLFKTMFYKRYNLLENDDAGNDVLIFYDSEGDSEDGLSENTQFAKCFQEVFSKVYGINTHLNLQGSTKFGVPEIALQVELFRQYPVILVLLGDETHESSVFSTLQSYLTSVSSEAKNALQKVLVLILDENRRVPECLPYPRRQLSEIGTFRLPVPVDRLPSTSSEPSQSTSEGATHNINISQDSSSDIVNTVFDGDLRSAMQLFGFLSLTDLKTGEHLKE